MTFFTLQHSLHLRSHIAPPEPIPLLSPGPPFDKPVSVLATLLATIRSILLEDVDHQFHIVHVLLELRCHVCVLLVRDRKFHRTPRV